MTKNGLVPKIVAVVGPTAVGKSALAIMVAKKFKGEIISADSRQVYRGLNIGTGKITKKEMRGIRHHLLDVADPRKQFTVVQFKNMAETAIRDIRFRNKLPIICGGTGFYIDAPIKNIHFPDAPPDNQLRKKLQEKSVTELFRMLKKLDPRRATQIDSKNKRRLIRAIEIATALGKVPYLEVKPPSKGQETLLIGITLSPEELRRRIATRLLARIRRGMLTEVKRLHKEGLSWKRMEELGLEYRYLSRYLRGKLSRAEMMAKLETEIWHYAKRQLTWFRRDKSIHWFQPQEKEKIMRSVKKFLA